MSINKIDCLIFLNMFWRNDAMQSSIAKTVGMIMSTMNVIILHRTFYHLKYPEHSNCQIHHYYSGIRRNYFIAVQRWRITYKSLNNLLGSWPCASELSDYWNCTIFQVCLQYLVNSQTIIFALRHSLVTYFKLRRSRYYEKITIQDSCWFKK